jgi:hypothetical protein
MKKFWNASLLSLLIVPAAFAAPPVQAPVQAPGKPLLAPGKAVQAPVQAPNKTAQANANTEYRTYSYQPGMTPNYGYNSNYNGRSNRYPGMFSGFQPADYKVRGQFNAR